MNLAFKMKWKLGKYFQLIFFTFLLQSSGFLLVNSLKFVYMPNYEYLSTVKLNDYNGYYGNVKLLRYSLPSDVLSAVWRLQVIATKSCPPANMLLYV